MAEPPHLAVVLVVSQELWCELANDGLEVVGADVGVPLLGPQPPQQVGVGSGQGTACAQDVVGVDIPLKPAYQGPRHGDKEKKPPLR